VPIEAPGRTCIPFGVPASAILLQSLLAELTVQAFEGAGLTFLRACCITSCVDLACMVKVLTGSRNGHQRENKQNCGVMCHVEESILMSLVRVRTTFLGHK
jgi:hypothetical protein